MVCFTYIIPRKCYRRDVESLSICQANDKKTFILLTPLKWLLVLFDSNRWFPLYLTGKVTLGDFLHNSKPILFLWMTLIRISYLYQWKRNLHSSEFWWGEEENIINVMPQMVNLGKGCLNWGWKPLLSTYSCRASPGTPFIFSWFVCFASSHYYSSIKHLISLLSETPPRDRSWSGLWKIFQTTQSYPSDFSWQLV